jgi:hypothetical protein
MNNAGKTMPHLLAEESTYSVSLRRSERALVQRFACGSRFVNIPTERTLRRRIVCPFARRTIQGAPVVMKLVDLMI